MNSYSQNYGFSSSDVHMWELNHKDGWAPKNWCFRTVVLEKTIENLLDSREIRPIKPKGNQPWVFIERIGAEAEAPIFWPSDAKSWLTGKDPDAGKNWGQEEKGETKDEMVGWYQRLNGHELEQTLGDSEGRGSLVCCSPWGCKESDTLSNWTTRNLWIMDTCPFICVFKFIHQCLVVFSVDIFHFLGYTYSKVFYCFWSYFLSSSDNWQSIEMLLNFFCQCCILLLNLLINSLFFW